MDNIAASGTMINVITKMVKKESMGITPAKEDDFFNMLHSIDKNIGSQVVKKTELIFNE